MSYKQKQDLPAARVNRVYEPYPELANFYYAIERLCAAPPSDRWREMAALRVAVEIFVAARAAHRAPWQRTRDLDLIRHCRERLNSCIADEDARQQDADPVRKLWLPGAN